MTKKEMSDVAARAINYISLYTGGGGLDLGFHAAVPGARAVCYVEREFPAAAHLVQAIADGRLDDAPVWSDSGAFDGKPWRGIVDCIIGGFPCQPFSVAGKKRGTSDDRWLWSHIKRIVGEVMPPAVFLENVPNLLSVNKGEALSEVLSGLDEMGFDARWCVVSAHNAGASHIRERLFILALGNTGHDAGRTLEQGKREKAALQPWGADAPLADAIRKGLQRGGHARPGRWGESASIRLDRRPLPFPPGPDHPAWAEIEPALYPIEPAISGVADGAAGWLGYENSIRLMGNGAVPDQVALALRELAID